MQPPSRECGILPVPTSAWGVLGLSPRDRLEALRGRTALVTGASSGIGEAFARQLSEAGLAVVAVARRAELLQALADELRTMGGRCEVLVADLTTARDRRRVGEVFARSEVAMLVNSAGVSTHGEFIHASPSQAENMVALNVAAMVALSKQAADAFAARGLGAIINVSSTAAFKPMAGLVVYGATKAFVKEMSLGLRLEVAARGVDVCVVFPGPVRTPMLESALGRPIAPATRIGRYLERSYFMDASVCVEKALAGFRLGKASVVIDPVDRAVVRLPRRLIRRLDNWAVRQLTGS
jgi:short-subunit dehydrogenase